MRVNGPRPLWADGARLLQLSPLHDCKWPREKNVRRPIASPARYVTTLDKADEVDRWARCAAFYPWRVIQDGVKAPSCNCTRQTSPDERSGQERTGCVGYG